MELAKSKSKWVFRISYLKKISIARVSTVPFFVNTQLTSQIEYLANSGCDVTVICSDGDIKAKNVNFLPVEIPRKVNLIKDFQACYKLYTTFKSQGFDVVHSTTPKAGLLCSLAGFFSRTPVRIHTFTGQTWAEEKGWKRQFFKLIDKLIVALNTHSYADSPSQRQFLINEKIARPNKLTCLGQGSLSGVDLQRFDPEIWLKEKSEIVEKLSISKEAFVYLFVGRVTIDKGIRELLEAFSKVLAVIPSAMLIVVGPIEDGVKNLIEKYQKLLGQALVINGFSAEPEKFFAIADVLVLPSYREGFGTTVIEAAAMGLPTIGTDIYGLKDAILDKTTGVLVPVRKVEQLYDSMLNLQTDLELRLRLSKNSKERAENLFSSEFLSKLTLQEYQRWLEGQR